MIKIFAIISVWICGYLLKNSCLTFGILLKNIIKEEIKKLNKEENLETKYSIS